MFMKCSFTSSRLLRSNGDLSKKVLVDFPEWRPLQAYCAFNVRASSYAIAFEMSGISWLLLEAEQIAHEQDILIEISGIT